MISTYKIKSALKLHGAWCEQRKLQGCTTEDDNLFGIGNDFLLNMKPSMDTETYNIACCNHSSQWTNLIGLGFTHWVGVDLLAGMWLLHGLRHNSENSKALGAEDVWKIQQSSEHNNLIWSQNLHI